MPRYRELSKLGTIPGGVTTVWNTDGSIYNTSKDPDHTWKDVKRMTDYLSPGWPYSFGTNPLTIEDESITHNPLFFKHKFVSVGRTSWTGFKPVATISPPVIRNHVLESNSGLGAMSYKRLKPGQPEINSLQSLVELRDLPKMVRQIPEMMEALKRFRFMKTGSALYLANSFGWQPILSDLANLYRMHERIERRLNQLKRDNGKVVRRSGPIRSSSSSNFWVQTADAFYNSVDWVTPPYVWQAHTIEDRVWSTIAFRYWIPDVGTSQWRRRAYHALLGTQPNLGVIWELTPWSWMADWFTNVGDVVSNLSANAAESLTPVYGSMMHTTEYKTTTSVSGRYKCGYPSQVSTNYTSGDRKQTYRKRSRSGVNPYELGITDLSLTARQIAISGALGISRYHTI